MNISLVYLSGPVREAATAAWPNHSISDVRTPVKMDSRSSERVHPTHLFSLTLTRSFLFYTGIFFCNTFNSQETKKQNKTIDTRWSRRRQLLDQTYSPVYFLSETLVFFKHLAKSLLIFEVVFLFVYLFFYCRYVMISNNKKRRSLLMKSMGGWERLSSLIGFTPTRVGLLHTRSASLRLSRHEKKQSLFD